MNSKKKEIGLIILVPIIYAFLIFFIYDFKWTRMYDMMSLTFFITLPYGVGVLSMLVSNIDNVKKLRYRITLPIIILFLFLGLTIIFGFEGWACWIMLFPILILSAIFGSLTAGYFKINQHKRKQRLNISLLVLIPLFFSPIESIIQFTPKVVETSTEIIIHANQNKIWNNVTRVYKITKKEDTGYLSKFLGFPRPLYAELDTLSINGYRKATFTKGLIFNEIVTIYKDKQLLKFDIKANTFEIPSTTMDKHILIGGDYFDMIDGEYQLLKISENKYKLKLKSHFKVSTSFNWYSGFLGRLIMNDIQTNILKIVKQRSEK